MFQDDPISSEPAFAVDSALMNALCSRTAELYPVRRSTAPDPSEPLVAHYFEPADDVDAGHWPATGAKEL